MYPLNKAFGSKDAGPNHENGVLSNVELASGPDGESALIAQFMIMMYGFYVYRLTISLMFFLTYDSTLPRGSWFGSSRKIFSCLKLLNMNK